MVFAVRVAQSRVVCFARVAAIFVAVTIGEETAKDAVLRVEDWEMAARGMYKCAKCGKGSPATLPPLEGKKRRRNNAAVDHIDPVVDPAVGFIDWNTYIERMFIEAEGYQVLCHKCQSSATALKRRRGSAAARSRGGAGAAQKA